ncbi:hypothetical protein [Chryseobacterium gambrini]|uniref:hypothetical protein n=1 Tax=Chryseobacterium gambrini TaxID=373672 RepID=UPI0022F3FC4E|nr:hypothetical protein [Chryseobacterium gambrini]WBX98241.1 hypothetical protein PE065_03050 [Chryseobacterium gambrini]
MMGLTWDNIRGIGASVVGEPAMKVLEGSFKMVQIVQKDGFAGLWEHVKDQFADLKATVMDTIIDIIKTEAIQAGIKFILGLLTPAGAFVKAAMMIIDLVKFFIQKAAQIMELVKAITAGIKAIASGNVAAVAKAIENALGRAIPVVIGFLASLAGLGGLVDKVTGVVKKIRQRVEKAIVKFWNFIKGKTKGLLGKIGFGDKKEKKEKKGEDLRSTEEKKRDLHAAVEEGTQLLKNNSLTPKEREKRLENIKQTYELKELKVVTEKIDQNGQWLYVFGKINPDEKGPVLRIKDGEKIELKSNEAAIIRKTEKRRHFKAVLPNHIVIDLILDKKDNISLRVTPLQNVDVEADKKGLSNYIIVNINKDKVEDFNSKNSEKFKALLKEYKKKKYGNKHSEGQVDCFTFAIDFLNGRLDGDLKPKPEGKDNNDRFEDLKKDRN